MLIFGIILALIALVSWGIGDFLIQKTSRDFGVWQSMFCITAFGAIVLFPFAYSQIGIILHSSKLLHLCLLGALSLTASLLLFEALKIGKMTVVEPIASFELPLTVFLGVVLLHEQVTTVEMFLIMAVFGGILLVGYTGGVQAKHLLEKGTLIALLAAALMAGVNFTTGLVSQDVGPITTIWFVHTFVALVCAGYFFSTRSWGSVRQHIHAHPYESIGVAMFDNIAWVTYAAAVMFIPISLAITISESYIILAIILGVIINKERLLAHQWIGVAMALVSVITLAAIH